MDFIKTPSRNRQDYCYTFNQVENKHIEKSEIKTKAIIQRGEEYLSDCGEIKHISSEDIVMLHRADDRIIYSNNKNANPDFRRKKDKPEEKQWLLSLDNTEIETSKNRGLAQTAVSYPYQETTEQRTLNDILEKLTEKERVFILRVMIRGEATKLAQEYQVSNKTIHAWKNKIITKIKENL